MMKMFRLLVVVLLVPVWSGPAGAQAPSVEGRPLVVFVHGRNQMWNTGSDLETRWFGALEDGMEKLAPHASQEPEFRGLVPDFDRVLVRYERVYEPDFRPSAWCGGVQVDLAGQLAAKQLEINEFVAGLRQDAEASGSSSLHAAALGDIDKATAGYMRAASASLGAGTVEKAGWVNRLLHALRDRAGDMFGADAGFGFVKDTALYLTKGPHHCETNLRLQLVLDRAAEQKRPVIIVAHSMGAMVTLDHLWRSGGAKYDVRRLVSLGAQLGMPDLLRYLAGAGSEVPLLPRAITDWTNIKGERDLLGYTVAPGTVRFIKGGPVVNSIQPTGDLRDAHDIARYLQLRTTATAIAEAYCDALEISLRPAACGAVPSLALATPNE